MEWEKKGREAQILRKKKQQHKKQPNFSLELVR